ncbi:MAG TPA: polysaccharide biosynthesis tyrosine autokinase [Acidimicrobiales bacterium]|nr:polysaccharide biosynthesis tyrosine autokinase [Acidimicrobiales bacterium]
MAQPEDRDALDLRHYLTVLRRRKWIVLVVTLLVTGASIAASFAQTPVYQGTSEVLLQAKASETLFDPNSGAYVDPVRAIETEIQVLRSRPVADLVRKEIGSAPKVTASAVGQTDVLQVQAESTDPERAALVANTYATAYIEFRRTQAVDDLLAAAEQIQQKITDLQEQIDEVSSTSPPTTARGPATTATAPAPVDLLQRKESLQQQQSLFRQKLDQLQVDAALKSGGAQLVTPAVAPTSPIRPTPRRSAVVALAVGLMLGVGLAFLREHLDDTLKAKDDVEASAGGVPVLGLIPQLKGWKDRSSAVVVSLDEPQSQAAEAYRSLRTSVQFLGLDRKLKVVQVTSPSESEGKSTTIANLAVGLATAGMRVVLVDADLRRPRIHEFFDLDHEVGFTSIIMGTSTLPGALQQVVEVPGLYLLASGPIPPNPSELLAGERGGDLLRSLADHADIVLVDCPPVLPVTDARVIAHRIDATLVVVSAGVTKKTHLERAIELLKQVDAPVVGVIVNGVGDGAAYGYGGNYRYTYAQSRRGGRRASFPAAVPSAPPAPPDPPAAVADPDPAPSTVAAERVPAPAPTAEPPAGAAVAPRPAAPAPAPPRPTEPTTEPVPRWAPVVLDDAPVPPPAAVAERPAPPHAEPEPPTRETEDGVEIRPNGPRF